MIEVLCVLIVEESVILNFMRSENVLDLVYPPVCGLCGKLDKNSLCKKCEISLCKQAEFVVEENLEYEYFFQEHIYMFRYEGIIRKMLLNYKFRDKSYMYKTFVNFLLKDRKIYEIIKSYDTIIPVPISKQRLKQRGYNQSLLIAMEIYKQITYLEPNTQIRICIDCLYKTKNIIEQSKLNRNERIDNIQNVYELKNGKLLTNRKILIVDDIFTTGSTVNECSKVIRDSNPRKIGVLTIAKD